LQTIIDPTLVSDSLVGAVKNLAVSDEHSFSDHKFIEALFSLDLPLPVSFANPRRAQVQRSSDEYPPHGTVRKHYRPTGAGQLLQGNQGKEKTPWLTQQLSILRTNCRCLFNRAKVGNEDTNRQNYKHELASYNKAIRRGKRTAWRTFCSDIEKTTDAARLRKILSKTATHLGYPQKANGSWSDSSKESLHLLLDAHFPGSQQTGHPPERGAGEEIELDPLLSDRNMKCSIRSFKPFKLPEPDGITPAHLQQAGQIAINWLKKSFQSILAVGELPTAWQETKVVFIPKARKATHTTAKDFKHWFQHPHQQGP